MWLFILSQPTPVLSMASAHPLTPMNCLLGRSRRWFSPAYGTLLSRHHLSSARAVNRCHEAQKPETRPSKLRQVLMLRRLEASDVVLGNGMSTIVCYSTVCIAASRRI